MSRTRASYSWRPKGWVSSHTMLTVALMERAPADVVHVDELDEPTGRHAPAGIFRGTLKRPVPFEISLDLDKLTPPQGN
ncbi:hypothetical protein SAMN04487981_106444 [Streptomyces sp. cf386]|nr:hypothetical protein SAMN04487981_106444 [Streptomyces sp. cf386]